MLLWFNLKLLMSYSIAIRTLPTSSVHVHSTIPHWALLTSSPLSVFLFTPPLLFVHSPSAESRRCLPMGCQISKRKREEESHYQALNDTCVCIYTPYFSVHLLFALCLCVDHQTVQVDSLLGRFAGEASGWKPNCSYTKSTSSCVKHSGKQTPSCVGVG